MKVLLINQNPVIKKLVGMASKKLNLEVENVARIAPDFNANNYICIIVDDENVGKNLERLTALQDQVKVCLLFARQTQIKKHEFNIAIQKPFLPTDILEILNDCIPKEGEINKAENHADSIASHDELSEYDDIHNINEIDMDLKSAEITPPDGIDIDSMKLQEEAEQIANEDTDSMLDFNPDSLDFSSLEAAGEVTKEAQDDEEMQEDNEESDKSLQNTETESSEINEDSKSNEVPEQRVGSIFDSDLSDLKPSGDNPLDLANFDLDSIMDSSALKAASLGIPNEIEEEAKEVANNISDEDDLFLSDDERDLLQPSPKKFMQALKEEEERKTKELEEKEISEGEQLDSKDELEVANANDSIEALNEELQEETISKEKPQTDIQNNDNIEALQADNDIDMPTNLDLESLSNLDEIEKETTQKEASKDQSTDNMQTNDKADDIQHLVSIDQEHLEDMGLTDNIDNVNKKDKAALQENIDTIDLSNLDETLKMQAAQQDSTPSTLDDAFDDLTAALNSAFENMSFDMGTSDNTNKDSENIEENIQEENTQKEDSKDDISSELDIENLDTSLNSNSLDIKSTNDIENYLDIENLETTNIKDESNVNEANDFSLENLESTNLDSINEANLKNVDTESTNNIDNELNLDDIELTSSELKQEDSNIDDLLQSDIKQEADITIDDKNTESSDNDLDLDSILSNDMELDSSATKKADYDELLDSMQSEIALDENAAENHEINNSIKQDENHKDDIDLDTMLDTSDFTETENTEARKTIIPQETIEEVNEALREINDDILINTDSMKDEANSDTDISTSNTELTSIADISTPDTELDSSLSLDSNDNEMDDLFSDLFDEKQLDSNENFDMLDKETNTADSINTNETDSMGDYSELDLLLDTNSSNDNEQLDSIESDKSALQDKDFEAVQNNDLGDMDIEAIEQSKNNNALYVTLPSNEDSIDKLTETELAEALGESEMPIVRLEQALDTESSMQDNTDSMQDTTESKDTSLKENAIPMETTTKMQDDKVQHNAIKELDANSIIDLFKNTPTDKLHEMFDGSEITFSIRFGKNSDNK